MKKLTIALLGSATLLGGAGAGAVISTQTIAALPITASCAALETPQPLTDGDIRSCLLYLLENGGPGPAGPRGPQGPMGPPGENGGPDGAPG
jgi:hypothetical protein